MAIIGTMTTIGVDKFKDVCLKLLDEVARTRTPIIITKRGRPVAQLMPYSFAEPKRCLAGSVVREVGDPYGTGDRWDTDRS